MAINLLGSKTIKKRERDEQIKEFLEPAKNEPEKELLPSPHDLLLEEHSRSAHLRWKTHEFEKNEWDRRWYVLSIIVLAVIILYALVSNNPIMAITFILIGVVGYLYLQKDPRILDFLITPRGIIVGGEIYEYSDIKSFWIFYEHFIKVISLRMEGKIMPHVHIPIGDGDPVKIREILLKYIPEEEQKLTAIDIIEKVLRL